MINKEESQGGKEALKDQSETTKEFVAKASCPFWIPSQ